MSVTAFGDLLTVKAAGTGSGTDYSYSSSVSYNSGVFSSPSFTATPSSGNLAGGASGGQVPLYSYNATGGYDANGNVLAYTDSVMGGWQFGYDEVNRLVTAANTAMPPTSTPNVPAPSWAEYLCWAYDQFGNRLTQANASASFTSANGSCSTSGTLYQNVLASYNNQNQMTQTNAPGWTDNPVYDSDGNITSDGRNTYQYDSEGRICAVTNQNGASTGYLYDAGGNRVAKLALQPYMYRSVQTGYWVQGVNCDMLGELLFGGAYDYGAPTVQESTFVVGPAGQQLAELGQSNHWNIYAGDRLIATYDSTFTYDSNGDPQPHYHMDDPLGTRRAQTDGNGTLEALYQSLPYGDAYAMAGNDDPTENHFTGKERDAESGNDYMFARYYNSATGRFLSPDWSAKEDPVPYAKLDNPQTLNLYAYVGNNPVARQDPDGHAFGLDDLVGALAGGAVGVGTEVVKDLATGQKITPGAIAGAAVGGAIVGEGIINIPETLGGSVVAAAAIKGAAQGAVSNLVQQGVDKVTGNQTGFDGKSLAISTAMGAVTGGLASKVPNLNVSGVSSGSGNMKSVAQGISTKIEEGIVSSMSLKTAVKGAIGGQVANAGRTVTGTAATAAATSICNANTGGGCK